MRADGRGCCGLRAEDTRASGGVGGGLASRGTRTHSRGLLERSPGERPRKSLPSRSLERGTLGGRGLYSPGRGAGERVQMRNVSVVCVVMPFFPY